MWPHVLLVGLQSRERIICLPEMDACRPSSSLPLYLLFSFSFTFMAALGLSDDTDAISSTCNHTLYFDVCMSTLTSRPSSRRADVYGLAAISLDVGITHAKATISYAKSLSKQKGFAGGTYASVCIADCLEEYKEAVQSLRDSTGALRSGSYDTVNALVSGAMTNSDTCESAFGEKPGLQSPLTERNGYFFKLCSNSIAITNLLA
ncbi:pectinesterase inhibitor-like [Musa acuminata AAA Group]|uniref:pectinesterase inhibitor-like n=1 Tax=Musa acuminata AAA Group TaxID=214697 RepID=UPI0031DC9B8B